MFEFPKGRFTTWDPKLATQRGLVGKLTQISACLANRNKSFGNLVVRTICVIASPNAPPVTHGLGLRLNRRQHTSEF